MSKNTKIQKSGLGRRWQIAIEFCGAQPMHDWITPKLEPQKNMPPF
jgi:hypothetical protein